VNRVDQVLEVRVVEDEPLVAVRVFRPPDSRARARRDDAEQLVELVLGPDELAGRQRLEDDRSLPRRLELVLELQRDDRRREREQLVARGLLQALAPEDDVEETQSVS
jgi:hypothetical protein